MAGRASNGESTIYKGADGRWHGYVSVGFKLNGRLDRRHVSSKSRGVVVAKVRELERKRDSGTVSETSTPTVAEWLEHWLTNIAPRRVRQRTLESYESVVRRHLIPGIGRHRLDRLRPEHLDQLYTALLDDGYSPASVLRHHRILSRALTVAVQRGHVPATSPRSSTRPPSGPATSPPPSTSTRPAPSWEPPPPSATPPAGPSPSPSGCASPRPSRCSGRTSTCSTTRSRSGAHPPRPRRWPDLRGAQDPAQPAHPRPPHAARRRAPRAQGRPARRADAGRLRVARRGPGLRPAQRPADRQEDRLRRLDPAAEDGRRPPRPAARRPAHRRHLCCSARTSTRAWSWSCSATARCARPWTSTATSCRRWPARPPTGWAPCCCQVRAGKLQPELQPRVGRKRAGEESPAQMGGAEGTRTPDPHTASVVRYQLRHSPLPTRVWCVRAGTITGQPGRAGDRAGVEARQTCTPRSRSQGTGLTRLPSSPPWCTSKCRCGPVDCPRLPSSAIVSPASTYSPGSTRILSMWP